MNRDCLEVLRNLPKGISAYELSAWHLIVVLERNGGNRSQAAEELRVALRTIHHLMNSMKVGGYEIPPHDPKSHRKPTSRVISRF